MELVEKNKGLLITLDNMIDKIWKNDKAYNKELASCIKEIHEVLGSFVGRIGEFKKCGIDVPEDVILNQIRNLMDAYENNDSVLLADTMEYEIRNTVLFYNDILNELKKES